MKKNSLICKIVLFSLVINITFPVFSEENKIEKEEEYEVPEISQGLLDLRRFEIITLGALPFIVLDSTLVYSGIRYFQNNFSPDYIPSFSQSFSQKEQLGIILTSVGISLAIGITDFIINLVKRNNKKKQNEINNSPIIIAPIDFQEANASTKSGGSQ